ncbi:MAG TPA: DoxX family protein [Terriglobales bacterium]|nr:DoxX family protein [Terriglobales bacterium]
MAPPESAVLSKVLVIARIVTGAFFLLFGEYKVFGSAFAHAGFSHYLEGYIQQTAVAFYRPVLSHIVLPHAVFFGYLVGIVELLIGIGLVFGIFVRTASAMGVLHMISLTLATWWEPGHGAPFWQYFGAELDHLPLLLLFLIFYSAGPVGHWRTPSRA